MSIDSTSYKIMIIIIIINIRFYSIIGHSIQAISSGSNIDLSPGPYRRRVKIETPSFCSGLMMA
jgi:hypothetical protein